MSKRYDLMALVPFDEVTSTTRGVLVKAALKSNAQSELGVGIGGTADTSTLYSSSGYKRVSAATGGTLLAIPTKAQSTFLTQGSIQYKVKLSELIAYATDAKIFYDTLAASSTVAGPKQQTKYSAAGASDSTYRKYTSGADGSTPYTDAIALTHNNGWSSEAQQIVFHSALDTDTDGFITVRESWNSKFTWMRINGDLASYCMRKIVVSNVADQFRFMTQIAGVTVKDLLIMNVPGEDPTKVQGYRVQFLLHSFGIRAQAYQQYRATGADWWDTALDGYTCIDGLTLSTLKNCTNSIKIINTSSGGKSASWVKQQLTGLTTGGASVAADGRFMIATTEVTPRYRPHMVVVGTHTNNTGEIYTRGSNTGTLYDAIMAQCAAAVTLGIVPIIFWEQNGNRATGAGLATYDHGANGTTNLNLAYAVYDAYIAAKALYGDVGFVDMWTPSGGDAVDGSFVENSGTTTARVHSTFKASKMGSELIAAEIDRLIATPPAYAFWK